MPLATAPTSRRTSAPRASSMPSWPASTGSSSPAGAVASANTAACVANGLGGTEQLAAAEAAVLHTHGHMAHRSAGCDSMHPPRGHTHTHTLLGACGREHQVSQVLDLSARQARGQLRQLQLGRRRRRRRCLGVARRAARGRPAAAAAVACCRAA
jgi:hypothetical protein